MSGAQENSTWAPILEDELADRAWVALRSLGAGITAFTEPVTDLATFWSYVAPALGDDAEVHHDAALDRLGSVRVRDLRGPSLFRGLAGFGWTVMHCIDGFDELLQIIDTALIDGLAGSEWRGHYDLISGLTGIGVYFLERGDARLAVTGLDEILRHLARLAVRTTDGITWHTPPEHIPPGGDRYPSGWFNVGLAHGVPGVIGLLGKLPRSPQVDELRNGAIDWVLAQRTDNPSRSRFPAFAESPVGRSTRTAWCYGDLGDSASGTVLEECLAHAPHDRKSPRRPP